MMRHTSAIVAVPSQADTRLSSIGVTEYQRSRGHVPDALDCKAASESSSHRASLNGSESQGKGFYVQRDVLRATEPKEFCRLILIGSIVKLNLISY